MSMRGVLAAVEMVGVVTVVVVLVAVVTVAVSCGRNQGVMTDPPPPALEKAGERGKGRCCCWCCTECPYYEFHSRAGTPWDRTPSTAHPSQSVRPGVVAAKPTFNAPSL